MSRVTARGQYRRAHLFANCRLQERGAGPPLREWTPDMLLMHPRLG